MHDSYKHRFVYVAIILCSSKCLNRLSVIDGWKSTTSPARKDNCFLFSKLLNQRMTYLALLHWFTPALHLIDMFILWTISSLTEPISGFVGLIRRHLVLLVKFSLWSFMAMKAEFSLVLGR